MLLYTKHVTMFLYYAITCFLMLTDHLIFVRTYFFYFFPVMMIYYMCLLHPRVNMIYKYNVTEKLFVRWSEVWQLFFHIVLCIYEDCLYTHVFCLLYCFLFKEMYFLVQFSEKRLSKIEESMQEKLPGYRIAHLHLDVFSEDIVNRFHKSCFDTNRLYILESTTKSRETQLGISNYREIRRNGRNPRMMTPEEKLLYIASSNRTMLISNREQFVLYPIGIVCAMLLCTLVVYSSLICCISTALISMGICSFVIMPPKYHDLTMDLSYAVASLVFAQLYYKNM